MEYQPKKEWNSAICKDIDGPRDCCIKWSMSEREKQISFNITYMWNLEKCYRWTYSQSKNRDTDVEHKCIVLPWGVRDDERFKILGSTYIHIMYNIDE